MLFGASWYIDFPIVCTFATKRQSLPCIYSSYSIVIVWIVAWDGGFPNCLIGDLLLSCLELCSRCCVWGRGELSWGLCSIAELPITAWLGFWPLRHYFESWLILSFWFETHCSPRSAHVSESWESQCSSSRCWVRWWGWACLHHLALFESCSAKQ